ncbi:hypothetical protein COV82_02565 [Candidatus Peregrinibacteria bacterium CG11_big_fil_rev_8_21_14_0_20_46_8]|nr:MAG: hypothetical protein COV82_02565 [Candidatus Peregrinibacteria bacterium CG11_big_fil_rev_8_21_14_0_20_46_8]
MINHRRGSALLIALITMSVLIFLSLGVSKLLLNALVDSRILLDTTAAFYAAESGIERGLLAISEKPPGFEDTQNLTLPQQGTLTPRAAYSYKISATDRNFPVRQQSEQPYQILRLNESVTIPLFSGEAPEDQIEHFVVEFYFAPELAQLGGGLIQDDLDMLRWKIFGISPNDGSMEVVNEFVPVDKGSSATTPTCIGTRDGCYNGAKFYQKRADGVGGIVFDIINPYPISQFLRTHKQNFLVLTNFVNVDLIAPTASISLNEKKSLSNIYYRIIVPENQPPLTLPHITLTADGKAGNAMQSLDIQVERKSFLPVFNYALYRTAE